MVHQMGWRAGYRNERPVGGTLAPAKVQSMGRPPMEQVVSLAVETAKQWSAKRLAGMGVALYSKSGKCRVGSLSGSRYDERGGRKEVQAYVRGIAMTERAEILVVWRMVCNGDADASKLSMEVMTEQLSLGLSATWAKDDGSSEKEPVLVPDTAGKLLRNVLMAGRSDR